MMAYLRAIYPVYLSNLLVPGAERSTSRGLCHGILDRVVEAEAAVTLLS